MTAGETMLHARVSDDPGTLRAWLGVLGVSTTDVGWRLNGFDVQPRVLRPLSPVHPAVPDMKTAVIEIDDVRVASHLEATVAGKTAAATLRRQPSDLPPHFFEGRAEQGRLNVLLMSCYHHAEERRAQLVNHVVGQLRRDPRHRPDLTLLLGDQVYLDLPIREDFPDDEDWLARKFNRQYFANWQDRIAEVFAAAPTLHTPDDHEYWNNYPEKSPAIGNSKSKGGRERWRAAAAALYAAYQEHQGRDPTARATPMTRRLRIGPLDFLFADTRSQRESRKKHGARARLLPRDRDAVVAWAREVRNDPGRHGVLVTGQSLFVDPASRFKGRFIDWELPGYRDYSLLVDALAFASRPGRPALAITGDVHWGRVLEARIDKAEDRRIYEVIVSPAALVDAPFDRLAAAFRFRDPYPRHGSADDPPAVLDSAEGKLRIHVPDGAKHRGDQLGVLHFDRKAGRALSASVTYFPVHPSRKHRQPHHVPLWT